MASTVIKRITDTAEKLHQIRQAIAAKEEENKRELEAMKTERDAIQAALLAELNKQGLSSVKVASGDTFTKSKRVGIEITRSGEPFALKWAIEHGAIAVNKVIAAQKLKDAKELPIGFQRVETEYISVRKSKSDHVSE